MIEAGAVEGLLAKFASYSDRSARVVTVSDLIDDEELEDEVEEI